MTHSTKAEFSKETLNPPETIVSKIRKFKEEIQQRQIVIAELKNELDAHYSYGTIEDKFSFEGATVTRKKIAQRYEFTEVVDQLKDQVQKRIRLEIDDDIAIPKPASYTWEFRAPKNDDTRKD